MDDCRAGVLTALGQALSDLGGVSTMSSWDGTVLYNAQTSMPGETVEAYDAVAHQAFGLKTVPSIPWLNRPTFQQVVEVK
jgi:hypothetical protein